MLSTAERTWILMVEYNFRMMVEYNLLVSQVYDSILFGVKIKSVKKVKKVDYPTIFRKAKIIWNNWNGDGKKRERIVWLCFNFAHRYLDMKHFVKC